MSGVTFIRYELKNLQLVYDLISDCCDGDFKIKARRTRYLPQPNPTDLSKENLARYTQYLERAMFYNVTKNTLAGLIGQIFSKDAQIELPPELEVLEENCDGKGNGIEQLAKQGISGLLKKGRFGLFADFPTTESEVSKEQIAELDIRPIIRLYESNDIINWRTVYVGAEVIYNLIVLREKFIYNYDEFVSINQYRYRVLKLNEDGNYQCDIYGSILQAINDADGSINSISQPIFDLEESFVPTDLTGAPFKRIPFEFCGTESNVAEPGVPVLYDIANLNIGHYRNSADYEESCYVVGQPTTWFAGLDQSWVDNVLKGQIQLGSRGGIPLPVGASAGILQPSPNTMPYEAMKHKEEQFLALGAKLVSPNSSTQTATEAEMNNTSETSILATLANNTSQAFENAIEHCQAFIGSTVDPKFKLNSDFEIAKMSVAERAQTIKEWQSGATSFTEMRNNLRKGKVELLEDEVAQTEIEQESMDSLAADLANPLVNPALAPKPLVGKVK